MEELAASAGENQHQDSLRRGYILACRDVLETDLT